MRRTHLRPQSDRQRAIEADGSKLKEELLAEVGHCEVCGHDPNASTTGTPTVRWKMELHEVARGTHRSKARGKRFASLLVCWLCHREKLSDTAVWTEARQLAVLRASRPADYDLAKYNALVGRGANRITEADVTEAEGTP